MIYPVKRDLDGCYFRVQREGKWHSLCWTDLTKPERVSVVAYNIHNEYWCQRMLEYITEQYRKTADQLDIYGGGPDEED